VIGEPPSEAGTYQENVRMSLSSFQVVLGWRGADGQPLMIARPEQELEEVATDIPGTRLVPIEF
jgi:hypothetical protein